MFIMGMQLLVLMQLVSTKGRKPCYLKYLLRDKRCFKKVLHFPFQALRYSTKDLPIKEDMMHKVIF